MAFLFLILYNGFDISYILKKNHIENSRFFIQCRDRFVLEIYDLKLPKFQTSEDNQTSSAINFKDIFDYLDLFETFFDKIEIRNFTVSDNLQLNILYKNKEFKILTNKKEYIQFSTVRSLKHGLIFIDKILVPEFEVKAFGLISLELKENGNIYFNLKSLVQNILSITSGKIENLDEVTVGVKTGKIKTLKPVLTMAKLPKNIIELATEQTKFKSLQIDYLFTEFSIQKPLKALKNLLVLAEIKNLQFIFEKNLKPVQVKNIILKLQNENLFAEINKIKYGGAFLNGILRIKNLFSDLDIKAIGNGKIEFDKQILKTVDFYAKQDISSKLKEFNVVKSGNVDFQFLLPKNQEIGLDVNLKLNNTKTILRGGDINFNLQKNLVKLSKIKFKYQDIAEGKISGKFNIANQNLKIFGAVKQIPFLENSDLKFNLWGDLKNLNLAIKPSKWNLENNHLSLSKLKIKTDLNRIVKIYDFDFNLKEYNLTGSTNIKYFIPTEKVVSNLKIDKFKFPPVFIDDKFKLMFDVKKMFLEIPTVKTEVDINKKIVKIENIDLFRKYLPDYLIYPKVEGNITTSLGDEKIIVDGNLTLPQKIIKNLEKLNFHLLKQDLNLTFAGHGNSLKNENLEKSSLFLELPLELPLVENNPAHKITALIKNCDFNISALQKFIPENNSSEETDENETNLSLPKMDFFIKNSTIYLTETGNKLGIKNGFISTDDKKIFLRLKPEGRGNIIIESNNKKFIIYARDLDEVFLQNITNFNDIAGGHYNIYLKGENQDFKGFAQFRSLKIKNLQLLNNVLAFINTVPALLTFSRPGFNENGLRILAGYLDFEKIGNKVYIKKSKIKGENIDFTINGYFDIENMKISLKVDISAIKYVDKLLENIPIANYLVLGENGTIATTLVIRGAVDNPKIHTEIHKEILRSPIEMGKRVYKLPQKMLDFFKKIHLFDNKDKEVISDIFQKFE